MKKPVFLSNHAKMTLLKDVDTMYFWKEYDFDFDNTGNLHRIFIYNQKGKLIACPRYIFIDTEKFKTKKKYFKEYFNNEFIDTIISKDYYFEEKFDNEFFIVDGKRFRMVEYDQHDLSSKDKSKIPYYKYDNLRNRDIPEHAIIVESSTKRGFTYTWKTVEGNKDTIIVKTFSLDGKLIQTEKYSLIKPFKTINDYNYSLLFEDNNIYLINNGVYYQVDDMLDFKSEN